MFELIFFGALALFPLIAAVALVLRSLRNGQSVEAWVVVSLTTFATISLCGFLIAKGVDPQLVNFARP